MIRKITQQHLEEAATKPVYKVVRDEDGRLKSLFVTGTKKKPCSIDFYNDITAVTLTYKPDRVISDGEYGIWCCKTLTEAYHQARWNGHGKLCRIYEVLPIGEPMEPPPSWILNDGTILYPAVIMGKEPIETIDNRGA